MKTWITRLQSNYKSLEDWRDYNQTYGLARKLGFVDALEAWHANPHIGGSTNPEDFGLVKLDDFTMGYITCALWSSHGGKYGECPCCGKMAVLDRWPEKEFEEQAMCSADGCGVREMNEEPPLDENYDIDDIAPNTLAHDDWGVIAEDKRGHVFLAELYGPKCPSEIIRRLCES